MAADHGAQGGLGDLVDRRGDVLDRQHRADGVSDAVVGDGGNIDADVVARDDALRLDRHRDDPHGDAVHAVHERHDEDQPGATRAAGDPPQPELHAQLVLLEYPYAGGQADQQQRDDHIDGDHVVPFQPDAPARGEATHRAGTVRSARRKAPRRPTGSFAWAVALLPATCGRPAYPYRSD